MFAILEKKRLDIHDQTGFAVRIKLVIIVYCVAVIVCVTHSDRAVFGNSDIVISVSDIKYLDASVRLYRPAKRSVLFRCGYYAGDVGHEVVIVKAILQYFNSLIAHIGEVSYNCDLNTALVEQSNIFRLASYGEQSARLEPVVYRAVRKGEGYKVVFAL